MKLVYVALLILVAMNLVGCGTLFGEHFTDASVMAGRGAADARYEETKSRKLNAKLHQKYVQKEMDRLDEPKQGGDSIVEPAEGRQQGVPYVLFVNKDSITADVRVVDTQGGPDATVLRFLLKPGETRIFPDDAPAAFHFRFENSYRITWELEHYRQIYSDSFRVTAKARIWDDTTDMVFNGGYIISRALR